MNRTSARIGNRTDEMPAVAAMVERFGAQWNIPTRIVNDVNVALDEVLSNIISYAYPSGEGGEIHIRLDLQPGEMIVDVTDAGRPFDPLEAPSPDLTTRLNARRVGGMGIHFIRSLVDEISYERVGRENRLRLRKRLPAA